MKRDFNFQGRLPILLSLLFVGTILTLVYFLLPHWQGQDRLHSVAFIFTYLLWLGIEARIAVKETQQDETSSDSGTLEIYAFARAITVITALAYPLFQLQFQSPNLWGAVVFLAGMSLRLWSIQTLGQFYSHRVRVKNDQVVIQTGPYQWLRHPAYTGMLVAHFGFVLFFQSLPALAVLILIFIPAVVLRISTEEKTLFIQLPQYLPYAQSKKRLIPGLW